MLIDWFTVAAQAVNFLILVWILKRVLYRPILGAMAKRQLRLVAELDGAGQAREAAERDAEEMRRKLDEMDRAEKLLLDEARRNAEQWQAEAMASMRREMEERREQWLMALARERTFISDQVRHRIGEQIVRLSEKVLRDIAGDDLEAQALGEFVARLVRKSPDVRVDGDVIIRTGFPLSQPVLQRLESSIREFFPKCNEIIMSEDAALGFGIAMIAGDNKWEWSLASYLDAVEATIFAELSEVKAGES